MSEDQIYELLKMIIPAIVGIFGGYKWAKSTIKINISQTQFNELKNSIDVDIKQINSQITELNNKIEMSIKSSSQTSVTVNANVNVPQQSVGSTGSEYNPLLEAIKERRQLNE